MPRIRRSAYLAVRLQQTDELDVGALLRGRIDVSPGSRLLARSALTGGETPITFDQLQVLVDVPESDWVERDGEVVRALLGAGLLIGDSDEPELAALRHREDAFARAEWHPQAAVFHAATRWRDVDVGAYPHESELGPGVAEQYQRAYVERFGPPPPCFHERADSLGRTELPLIRLEGELGRVLRERRTTRAFDAVAALPLDRLSALLSSVFGCHGTTQLAGEHLALRKTSPSAGALHAIEAYPLLVRVDGIEPGLYHYRTRDHTLDLLRRLDTGEAGQLATSFMCGQDYLAGAAAIVILTARFYRSFWKYRRHERAYATLLLDAGHLSQTFYLVAAELGLGAFVTAAINGADIDDCLGTDHADESAVAICGCGIRSDEPSELEPKFEPYLPRA